MTFDLSSLRKHATSNLHKTSTGLVICTVPVICEMRGKEKALDFTFRCPARAAWKIGLPYRSTIV